MIKPQILIIEDEAGIRITLEDRLKAEGYAVQSCTDGLTGQTEALKSHWAVILLDLMLPHRDGLSICHHLRTHGVQTPILMLTARNTDLDQITGLHQGADDYLGKPFDMGVLLARVQALIRRSSLSTDPSRSKAPGTVRFARFTINLETGEFFDNDTPHLLNLQEFRLLAHMVENPNKLLSRNELLKKVWGWDAETSTRTIDVHIAKLRHHLGESDQPRHIQTIRGMGYKFVP